MDVVPYRITSGRNKVLGLDWRLYWKEGRPLEGGFKKIWAKAWIGGLFLMVGPDFKLDLVGWIGQFRKLGLPNIFNGLRFGNLTGL